MGCIAVASCWDPRPSLLALDETPHHVEGVAVLPSIGKSQPSITPRRDQPNEHPCPAPPAALWGVQKGFREAAAPPAIDRDRVDWAVLARAPARACAPAATPHALPPPPLRRQCPTGSRPLSRPGSAPACAAAHPPARGRQAGRQAGRQINTAIMMAERRRGGAWGCPPAPLAGTPARHDRPVPVRLCADTLTLKRA
jgi:hypothetical protein